MKIRGPDQGINPSVKKMRLWDQSNSTKAHVVGPILQITIIVIPEQHFLSALIESQKLLSLGSDAEF